MAVEGFIVAGISTSATGLAGCHAVQTGMSRTAATRLAFELCSGTGGIFLVGSPHFRGVDILLPGDVRSSGLGPAQALTARVENWIEALRAHGELVLSNLTVGSGAQRIPAEWLTDPLVLACLRIVLSPAASRLPDDISDPCVWLDAAPAKSIAGLLRESEYASGFLRWISQIPESSRSLLRIPLYEVDEDETGCLRISCWTRRNHTHPFLSGEVCQLDIDVNGAIWPRLNPMRADDAWQLIDRRVAPALDSAWHHSGDLRLDRLFQRLPKLAESLLLDGAGAVMLNGADPQVALDTLLPLSRWLERRLQELTAPLTAMLLGRTYLTGVPAPRLAHARYLQADGDAELAARRRQAIGLWPSLATDLAEARTSFASNAIDGGLPLIPALATDFGVPGWAVRRVLHLLRAMPPNVEVLPEFAQIIASAGPHAPPITCDDLPMLASWRRLVPDVVGGPWSTALVRALGKEAAQSGWHGVARLLNRPHIEDECDALIAWWVDLRRNVRDVLSQTCPRAIDSEFVERTFSAWTSDLTISSALDMAIGWRNLMWGELQEEDEPCAIEFDVPALFGTFSLMQSQVQVCPLTSLTLLREEGQRMLHCAASYWRAVASGRRIVLSLVCSVSGDCATVAWTCRREGGWIQGDAVSKCNAPIPKDSRITFALGELASLLADEGLLNPDALSFHRGSAQVSPPRAADYAIDGGFLVATFPSQLAHAAMRWLPGAGTLGRRVLHAAGRADQLSRGR